MRCQGCAIIVAVGVSDKSGDVFGNGRIVHNYARRSINKVCCEKKADEVGLLRECFMCVVLYIIHMHMHVIYSFAQQCVEFT